MSHPALKRYSYLGQFAILAGLTGVGLIIGSIISLIPLLSKTDFASLQGKSQKEIMDLILVPENTGILRLVQFLSTLFIFFIPAFCYAWISHKKPALHLGLKKPVNAVQIAVTAMIMLAALPVAGALGDLTEMLPFSKEAFEKFRAAEEEYARQVEVIGRMNNFGDFILALIMMAILPALFEETLFRGGLQNLLSRWWKTPVIAIVATSLLFSAVHFSYLGFLSRALLGFILGWMYYRTGNLWISITGHVINNAIALTVLYVMKSGNPALTADQADPQFPYWMAIISLVVLIGFFILFEIVNKHQVDKPGEEVLTEVDDHRNPSWANTSSI